MPGGGFASFLPLVGGLSKVRRHFFFSPVDAFVWAGSFYSNFTIGRSDCHRCGSGKPLWLPHFRSCCFSALQSAPIQRALGPGSGGCLAARAWVCPARGTAGTRGCTHATCVHGGCSPWPRLYLLPLAHFMCAAVPSWNTQKVAPGMPAHATGGRCVPTGSLGLRSLVSRPRTQGPDAECQQGGGLVLTTPVASCHCLSVWVISFELLSCSRRFRFFSFCENVKRDLASRSQDRKGDSEVIPLPAPAPRGGELALLPQIPAW